MIPEFDDINLDFINKSIKNIISENDRKIKSLIRIKEKTYTSFVQPLVYLNQRLYTKFTVISHLNSVVNSSETQKNYVDLLEPITQYYYRLNQNKDIYLSFEEINRNNKKLSIAQKKVIKNNLINFELAGIHLEKNLKKQIEEIDTQLSVLYNNFSQNVLEANSKYKQILNEKEIKEFPKSVQNFSSIGNGKYEFSLQEHSYSSFTTYSSNRKLREKIYKQYTTRAPENLELIEKILFLRQKKSKILHFNNFVEYSLQKKSANSPKEVLSYLEEIIKAVQPYGKKELEELKHFAKESLNINDLQAYDIKFVSEKLKQKKYKLEEEEYKPYFEKNQVIQGIFEFIKKLFGIEFEKIKAKVWNKKVLVYNLIIEKEIQARLFLDLETRNNKQNGAWMTDWYSKAKFDKTDIKPIAFVICNFPPESPENPSLLTHNDVVTFFHEMGHALHHICSKITEPEVSGVNGVEWDIVEFPSQFLENFAYEKKVLQLFAKHYQTGELLPENKMQTLKNAKNHLAALSILRQMEFALFDILIHYRNIKTKEEVQETLNEVRKQVSVLEVPDYNHFQSSFLHIFAGGYAAGYYSYKWAEVLSADTFIKFAENDILEPKLGKKYLDLVFSQGGSKNGLEIFEEFMGRKPRKKALLESYGIL